MAALTLFPHINEEQLSRILLVSLHILELSMLRDLIHQKLACGRLPPLARKVENELTASDDALKPKRAVSNTEFSLLKA